MKIALFILTLTIINVLVFLFVLHVQDMAEARRIEREKQANLDKFINHHKIY
jgi:hypothetical protein